MPRQKFEQEIDLTATVTTPENVQFDYKIAGFGRRLPAFLIDVLIRISAVFVVFVIVVCSGSFLGANPMTGAIVFAIMAICYFIMSWFYGVAFEYLRNGKTPGKSIMGIQTVMADGRPVNLIAAIVRNVCRTADIMPIFVMAGEDVMEPSFVLPLFLPAIVCMCITKRFQRLGDIAANTIVVVVEPEYANRFGDIRDERMEAIASQLPADLILKPSTVQALSLYIDRRLRLNTIQREELCAILINAIRSQFDLPSDVPNDALACALHYREFYKRDDKFDLDELVNSKDRPTLANTIGANAVRPIAPLHSTIGDESMPLDQTMAHRK